MSGYRKFPGAKHVEALEAELVALRLQLAQREAALNALNQLRSNVIATQNASWSNALYPMVAILDAAGYKLIEGVSEEQRKAHLDCYGGAGNAPGLAALAAFRGGEAKEEAGDR